MGYTHYFAYDPTDEAFEQAWPRMVADAAAIVARVEAAGIAVRGPHGVGRPEITSEVIAFNGTKRGDRWHESLVIEVKPPTSELDPYRAAMFAERKHVWAFCKTARKPYDVAVAAVLLRCHLILPSFGINSDGAWDDEWKHGASSWAGNRDQLTARGVVAELFGDDSVIEQSPFRPLTV